MGNEQRLKTLAANFLKNASSQLADGSTWLHEHHDEMFEKNHNELTEEDIAGLMRAACENSEYDQSRYRLVTSIPLKDSDGIQLLHPTSLKDAIAENIQEVHEPPSLNLHHRADLLSSIPWLTMFQTRFKDDQVPDCLRQCRVAIKYSTWPFDDKLVNPVEPEWSRSISLIHIPEIYA